MDERANGPELPGPDDASRPEPEQRPIPTDGLAEALPDWLQRSPAWRGMTVREPDRPELPPPDTSVIDPRTMLEIDDLPVWLQRIAARSKTSEATETDLVRAAPVDPPAPATREVSLRLTDPPPGVGPGPPDTGVPAAAIATRERSMTPAGAGRSPTITFRPSTLPERQTRWWASRAALGALAAFVVFVIIWVILVAT